MAFAARAKLGSYEVLAQIGAGATSLTNCDARPWWGCSYNRVKPLHISNKNQHIELVWPDSLWLVGNPHVSLAQACFGQVLG